ncbi:MAG: acetyl-CoA acetyltransferase [Desulfobacterales bacterium RIFOXYA12_FULL_46_15]|nr:MAG: acetyl-CoA acetyltransferase [Desulfobacula sp. GWF2_41_7]OGR28318.1 MAG: acetyl-CoA acetyltransferase [Desulfobacterales bacterium RIFOXYA12_FULL_46_15]
MYTKAFIPYKGYYSTPFCKWQCSLANENSIFFAAQMSKQWFASRNFDVNMLDYSIFGNTIGQHHQFYASPWSAALLGANSLPAIAVSQACTTGATCINLAAMGIESGLYETPYVLTTDRTSNGPHTIWPNPNGPGGEVISENWNMDNFNADPNTGKKMVETAENVARENGFTKEECDELVLRRYEQYLMATENNRAFQKRYMLPAEIKISKKKTVIVEEDEGIMASTKEGLAALKPTIPGGVLSFGAQTHPADGNAGIIVTTANKARELSADEKITIQVVAYGYSRERKGYMPAAPVPATRMALKNAGLSIKDISVIKTHNPFIVNDLFFSKEMGVDPKSFNNYGSSLIFGHPQGPTATRLIIEGIEETVMAGGGYCLWTGCAAGDCGAALILKIS